MTSAMNFSGKKVLVAGSGDPVQQAIAKAFVEAGASAGEVDILGAVQSAGADAVSAKVKEYIATTGGLDVLVVTLGINDMELIEAASADNWQAGFSMPLKAAFFAAQAAIPALRESSGAIVNVTSTLGQMGAAPGLAIPAAAMACLIHHTRMLSLRLSLDGVRVNCVCQGYTSEKEIVGLTAANDQPTAPTMEDEVPMGRLTLPEDVVGPVLFLASPLAGFMTGNVLSADGGTFSGH
ncbi:SDR family oxidoreductase [Parahaliea maris]|uniref:SDR family oxidoreductase n=1 Tax=Parahaliea maris TaxID=2716870 RepID=A0A5C8ZTS4_9GAMM|nr:SDR family oxidoreductase [Parahaliea maris]TXS91856.1 SDR family oxidoreductase [Parahaliea maris]